MEDWASFAKTSQETATVTGANPNPWAYLIIKSTDNFLGISVFVLTLVFASIGLFGFDSTQIDKTNWALHAAELSLGVFLGLLKTKK
ncbi:hypothetical protein ACFL6N_05795 [Thermodesulfobacteriota bacterium]